MAQLSTHLSLSEPQEVCLGQQLQTQDQGYFFAVHTWRPIKQHPSGRGQVKALKELWVDKRQEHHLLEGLDVMLQAPYLIKAD